MTGLYFLYGLSEEIPDHISNNLNQLHFLLTDNPPDSMPSPCFMNLLYVAL